MKKICKKLLIIITALALSASALIFGGCDYTAKGLEGDYQSGEVTSQGGWVVRKGKYVYFINGMTTAPTDADGNTVAYENKYGDAVRGALMRVSVEEMDKGDYSKAETVVPLLFVASDYTSGIFIYGDYVYYATPTTAKNLEGKVEANYVDFKRSRLDGSETMKDYYFRSSDASAEYRFVEVDGVVYCLHMNGSDLYSFNTNTNKDTLLVKNASSHVFHKTDLSDPYVYYTMSVTQDIDQTTSVTESYNQVYRVRADATYELDKKTASYTVKDGTNEYAYSYTFDKDSLEKQAKEDEDNDFDAGKIETYPYVNLGQAVLDGVGKKDESTQYNHSEKTPYAPDGYTYTLIGYENDGLYYRRQYVGGTGSTGESGWTFYLADASFDAQWDAVTGNAQTNAADFGGANEVISVTTTNVSSSSLFYVKDGVHYYLYLNGSNIVRVKIGTNASGKADGSVAEEVTVAKGAYASAFLSLDNSDSTYKYVYYTVSNTNGTGVGRAVYDSTEAGYAGHEEDFYNSIIGRDEYKPVSVLEINHVSNWYSPEIIDGRIYFADCTTLGSMALNNAQLVSIRKDSGVMNNKEIKEYNELLKETETALVAAADLSDSLSNALYHYYYTGDGELFGTVIKETAEKDGYGEYSLFSAEEQKYFNAYVTKQKYENGKISVDFSGLLITDDGEYYGLRSYFYHTIGVLSEDEQENLTKIWEQTYLSAPAEEETDGLPAWAWALIGIGIGVGVIGIACAIVIPVVLRNKKKKAEENAPKRKKYTVDMTYDETIDVYADGKAEDSETESPAEESSAEEASIEGVPAEETSAEESSETQNEEK